MKRLILLVSWFYLTSCEIEEEPRNFNSCSDLSVSSFIADSSEVLDVLLEEKINGGLIIHLYENGKTLEPIRGEFCGEWSRKGYKVVFDCCSDTITILDL